MISTDQIQDLLSSGGTVVGGEGEKIGKIGQVYLDDETGKPEWVTAKTGMFGGAETFIPLAQGTVDGDAIRVPYDKDKVRNAPRMDDAEGHLSKDQEAGLYEYYGLAYSERKSDSGLPAGGAPQQSAGGRKDRSGEPAVQGRDTSGPTTDDAMTRSEERLNIGTEKVESGKARLHKYVVTENVSQTVPVSHEEVRIEREPITEANRGAAMAGGDLTSEEHEVTLHAERPVVEKETVPVERVRLGTETVTGEQQVNEEVRKEKIDTSEVGDAKKP
ncbi:PRC and DUF2382 domain-containing protein [Paenarthrobacter sp. PH39-S1]|uniref:PRC and DUF2382 domain-containing protein n=1 Tax=Paenarthrobacter sp. PH39-S1 TaxID=3046204 RepID=UPI0024BA538D|nr:PRC and DUF2382 domain-containing protein [Paenarthrobacter sp. PH39-S1]MDJ0355218.1 PRC and DUF2382 domain-containing protein [Paenarthrobacter sp. PH39-S1]